MASEVRYDIPKKPWHSEEAMAFRRRVRVSCFYPRRLKKRRAAQISGRLRDGRRLCSGRERRAAAAAARNVSRARYARRPSSVRPPAPVAAQAMLAAPHFQKAYQHPRHIRRSKRFRPQGMFAAQGIIPASAAVDGKSRRLSCAVHSPRPDAAGLMPAGAAHRSLFRPSVQQKSILSAPVPAERLA